MTPRLPPVSALLWPVMACASLSAHVGIALWAMSADAAQSEGDIPAPKPLAVVFIPPPAPLAPVTPELVAPKPTSPSEKPLEPQAQSSPPPIEPRTKPIKPDLPEQSAPPEQPKQIELTDADALPTLGDEAPSIAPSHSARPVSRPDRRVLEPETTRPREPKEPVQKAVAEPAAATAPATAQPDPAGSRKWAAKIRSRIERRKRYPDSAEGAEGSVGLVIVIAPSGALVAADVAATSGNTILDAAAVQAVQRAAPFPAAPAGTGPSEFSLTMTFASR